MNITLISQINIIILFWTTFHPSWRPFEVGNDKQVPQPVAGKIYGDVKMYWYRKFCGYFLSD